MADVSWASPGSSGNWDATSDWTGLAVGASYPGQFPATADTVTIGGTNSSYIVTFNVPSVTIASLTVVGGNGTPHDTILRMTAGCTLNIQGGITLLKQDSPGNIDGAGTISVDGGAQINATGNVTVQATITAGTDTTGGLLDLTGAGSVSAPLEFDISAVAPATLEFDLAGGVTTTGAIAISDANQTLEVGPSGILAIGAAENVTNGTILMSGGTLTDASGISFGTKSSGGSLSGFGTLTGTLGVSGSSGTNTVTASGGTLILTTAIDTSSGLVFAVDATSGSALQLSAATGSGNTFNFLGSSGALELSSSAASGFANRIGGLNVGNNLTPTNVIDILGDTSVTVVLGQAGSGTSGTVTLSDGAILNLSGITNGTGTWFVNTALDSAGTGTDVFLSTLCFVTGTRILTAAGECPVEKLSIGDHVMTLSGKARPIQWIGSSRVLATRGRRNAATPVIVRKGALADNVPCRDLHITKGHALCIDDALIPVEELINHRSILWDDMAQEVSVYHIELETHDVLLANGALAESYRDDGNRWLFRNANSGWDLPPQEPCRPVLSSGPVVDAIWRRLLDRVGPRPGLPLTDDPDLHLMVDGRRIDATARIYDRYVFHLDAIPAALRIVSHAGVPAELGIARDMRALGVAIRRVEVGHSTKLAVIDASDPKLACGFHDFEPHDGIRWTDGDALLPIADLAAFEGPVTVDLLLGGATQYALVGTQAKVAA